MLSRTARHVLAPTAALAVATGLAGPAQAEPDPGRGPRPDDAAPVKATLSTTQIERRLTLRTNTRRVTVGCPRVKVHKSLKKAALVHSTRMARRGVLSHQLPGEPGLARRINGAGYHGWKRLAENVAWDSTVSADRIFNAWLRSPGHRRNIQNCALREIGIGVRFGGGNTWATQDFGTR